MKKSSQIIYSIMIVIVYLTGRAYVLNELLSTGLATGILVGMVFGSLYLQYKIKETKGEIKNVQ